MRSQRTVETSASARGSAEVDGRFGFRDGDVDPAGGGASGRGAVGVRAGQPVLHPAAEEGTRPWGGPLG